MGWGVQRPQSPHTCRVAQQRHRLLPEVPPGALASVAEPGRPHLCPGRPLSLVICVTLCRVGWALSLFTGFQTTWAPSPYCKCSTTKEKDWQHLLPMPDFPLHHRRPLLKTKPWIQPSPGHILTKGHTFSVSSMVQSEFSGLLLTPSEQKSGVQYFQFYSFPCYTENRHFSTRAMLSGNTSRIGKELCSHPVCYSACSFLGYLPMCDILPNQNLLTADSFSGCVFH